MNNNSHDPLDTNIRQHQSTGDPVIDTLIHTRPRADAQHSQQLEDELVALLAREHLPRKKTMQTTQTLSRPFRLQIAPTMVAAMILIAVSVVALLTYGSSPSADPSSPNTLLSPTATPNGPQSMVAAFGRGDEMYLGNGTGPIVILSDVGDITIRAGNSEDGFTVNYDKVAYGRTQEEAEAELAAMQVTYNFVKPGNILTLDNIVDPNTEPAQDEADEYLEINALNMTPPGDSQSNVVNLTITLPTATTLTITNNVGNIHIEGTTLSDLLTITNHVGDIEIRDSVLPAGLEATTSTGAITFAGDVSGEGTAYTLNTAVGNISAVLPQTVSVVVAASAEVGTVTGPDALTNPLSFVEADLSGVLGNGGPMLTLTTDVGDVSIQLK